MSTHPFSPEMVPLIPAEPCVDCGGSGYIVKEQASICHCRQGFRVEVSKALPKRWHDKHLWDLSTDGMKGQSADLFKKFLGIARRYASEFSSTTKRGLKIEGPVGVGKSHIAAGILKEVILRGFRGTYWNFAALSLEARSGEYGMGEHAILQKCRESHLVVLDDVGVEKASEFSARLAYEIIETRMDISRPTIVTTNCDDLELKARYGEMGERLSSRFAEHMVPIVLGNFPDYRRK